MKTRLFAVLLIGCMSHAQANEEAVSVQQQAIDNFKLCVEQVVASGGGGDQIDSACQGFKATLNAMVPGLANNIAHTLLQQATAAQ